MESRTPPSERSAFFAMDLDRRDLRFDERRLTVRPDRRRGDLVHERHRTALAEDRVVAFEVRRGVVGDEELHAVGVRSAVRHAQLAGVIVLPSGPDLFVEDVAQLPAAVSFRVVALYHDSLFHAI